MTPEMITTIGTAAVAIIGAVASFVTVLIKLKEIHGLVNSNLEKVNARLDNSLSETKLLREYIGRFELRPLAEAMKDRATPPPAILGSNIPMSERTQVVGTAVINAEAAIINTDTVKKK